MPATITKDSPKPAANGSKTANTVLVPFTRAAREHVEPMTDVSQALTSTSTQLGPYEVPAYGYMRGIVLDIEASGGAGAATASADAPWNLISEIALIDVNGANIVGPISGYDLYLINKYGGYSWAADPKASPLYSAPGGSGGNFRFTLRVPVEISARDALGAMPNANAASTWKLRITLSPSTTVYTSVPATTLPTIRIKAYLDAWSQPPATDLMGRATAQMPPVSGTTSYWTKNTKTVAAGQSLQRIDRMGNLLRNIIFVMRDNSGVRTTSGFPDTPALYHDTRLLKKTSRDLWRHEMYRKTGYSGTVDAVNGLDTGVFVEGYTHDFDGHPGGELRDLWIPTQQSTRFELEGTYGAGTLGILINDVAAPGEIYVD